MAWAGVDHRGEFHATEDQQAIRDRVFGRLARHRFRVDSTILQKRKAQPHLVVSEERFYQYAWYFHMRRVAPSICGTGDEVLVVASSIGTRRRQAAFHAGVADVLHQTVPALRAKATHWPSAVDTGLQIADYCGWAIQRKWERGDDRSHVLIKDKISSEFDMFRYGRRTYY